MKKIISFLLVIFMLFSVCSAYEVFTDETSYTTEEFQYVLENSRSGLYDYAWTIIESGKYYGINPLYLLAKFGLESGWGTSYYFKNKNNIGGWRNYDGTFRDFDSVESCIWHICEGLTEYNDKESWKYTGNDMEKICYRYCQDDGYYELMVSIMDELQDEIVEFRIENEKCLPC
jgi:hypothetical protein